MIVYGYISFMGDCELLYGYSGCYESLQRLRFVY